ncbi:DUF397 domain-containing protein [Streptomyces globosus]|uniref:DUF397 domain-containing protein n=1 Tax=Streptomyces globosus TaxID=68209 RepID=A0A344U799_9ACTN|nr:MULTISPECIES: DUF397 domain-containing protein [Streptomyces]AXE26770.1 DUF397 domain-containing protein [Streptomyces globosus]
MNRNFELVWFKSSYSDSSDINDCVEVAWVKSSYSSSSDINDCVEVGWAKSSHSSGSEGDSCVEVASTPAAVLVRDSKDTAVPHLSFSPAAWAGFVAGARQA